jgi:hypothetical protein
MEIHLMKNTLILFTLTAFASSPVVLGQDQLPEANTKYKEIIKNRSSALADLELKYNNRKNTLNKKCIDELNTLLISTMKKGDLYTSNLINKKIQDLQNINKVKKDLPKNKKHTVETKSLTKKDIYNKFIGDWDVHWDNGGMWSFNIQENGTITCTQKTKTTSTWDVVGKSLHVKTYEKSIHRTRIHIFTLKNGKITVDHCYPDGTSTGITGIPKNN